jgi:hypothetical protein
MSIAKNIAHPSARNVTKIRALTGWPFAAQMS